MIIALFDEYIRASKDYKNLLNTVSQFDFDEIKDKLTKDKDCQSIKSITTHIVQAGYTYANYINTVSDKQWQEYTTDIVNPKSGILEIDNMFDYTEVALTKVASKSNEDLEKYSFETRWNVIYDFEQLMEHAIVHILRHRRQVEKMLVSN